MKALLRNYRTSFLILELLDPSDRLHRRLECSRVIRASVVRNLLPLHVLLLLKMFVHMDKVCQCVLLILTLLSYPSPL